MTFASRTGVPHGRWKTTNLYPALRLAGMTARFVYGGANPRQLFLA
ncbi:hypothetical protein [Chelativorans sp. Marseille-P2723]|nr:hypothetical protein [Chelativorans sp. Marseille-P2723]